MDVFKNAQHVHFIGVGGIGISAVARMFVQQGRVVTGSDRSASEVSDELSKAGATITIGQKAENLPLNCELVVYTVAIPEDNPELALAKHRGIPLMTYPETLKRISEEKYTIAVSGTHGKTTVVAMIASVLIEANLDPTVLVGSLMKDPKNPESIGTNFIAGNSKYFIVEADEYKKSFHNLYPTVFVINNIDEDHLDFYKDLADIQASFRVVAERVPKTGFIICNPNDPHVAPVIAGVSAQIIDYKQFQQGIELSVPGEHNRSNAAEAMAVAQVLTIEPTIARKALQEFKGTWRRFQYKGTTQKGALVYDDYAHNPMKVRAAIQGARELFPDKKITIIFQPHTYSRTKHLFKEFSESFNGVDDIILLPIYAAREVLDPTISSELLRDALKAHGLNAQVLTSFQEAQTYADEHSGEGDVIMTVGAGDITTISDELVKKA